MAPLAVGIGGLSDKITLQHHFVDTSEKPLPDVLVLALETLCLNF